MVNPALEAFLNLHLDLTWSIQPLRQGAVNRCWKVVSGQRNYFLKQQGVDCQTGVDRAQEVRLQIALSENTQANSGQDALCPEIVAVSTDYQWVLFNWLEADNLADSVTLKQREKMQTLGRTLHRIHQQQVDLPRWSLAERLQTYLAACSKPVAEDFLRRLTPFQALVKSWDSAPATFCHNDLALEHILMTNPIAVVDWEYAGYGHPWFDIASAIVINDLSTDQQEQLCSAYQAASGIKIGKTDLIAWCQLVEIINDLWSSAQKSAAD